MLFLFASLFKKKKCCLCLHALFFWHIATRVFFIAFGRMNDISLFTPLKGILKSDQKKIVILKLFVFLKTIKGICTIICVWMRDKANPIFFF